IRSSKPPSTAASTRRTPGRPMAAEKGPYRAWAGARGPSAGGRPPSGRGAELRLHGLNAVRAVFRHRPGDIRKLYLAQERIPVLQPLLKWCLANRVSYRVVEADDLRKLAASTHHEGLIGVGLRRGPLPMM